MAEYTDAELSQMPTLADYMAELTRLRAECERLEAALRPFADEEKRVPTMYFDHVILQPAHYEFSLLMAGDFRRAAAALKEAPDEV